MAKKKAAAKGSLLEIAKGKVPARKIWINRLSPEDQAEIRSLFDSFIDGTIEPGVTVNHICLAVKEKHGVHESTVDKWFRSEYKPSRVGSPQGS